MGVTFHFPVEQVKPWLVLLLEEELIRIQAVNVSISHVDVYFRKNDDSLSESDNHLCLIELNLPEGTVYIHKSGEDFQQAALRNLVSLFEFFNKPRLEEHISILKNFQQSSVDKTS